MSGAIHCEAAEKAAAVPTLFELLEVEAADDDDVPVEAAE